MPFASSQWAAQPGRGGARGSAAIKISGGKISGGKISGGNLEIPARKSEGLEISAPYFPERPVRSFELLGAGQGHWPGLASSGRAWASPDRVGGGLYSVLELCTGQLQTKEGGVLVSSELLCSIANSMML